LPLQEEERLSRCLPEGKIVTDNGEMFSIHGCDTGIVSEKEYYDNSGNIIEWR
jgi:hypothetical protein